MVTFIDLSLVRSLGLFLVVFSLSSGNCSKQDNVVVSLFVLYVEESSSSFKRPYWHALKQLFNVICVEVLQLRFQRLDVFEKLEQVVFVWVLDGFWKAATHVQLEQEFLYVGQEMVN